MEVVLAVGTLAIAGAVLAWLARTPPAVGGQASTAEPDGLSTAAEQSALALHETWFAAQAPTVEADTALHEAYVAGHHARVRELLEAAHLDLNSLVTMLTALGRYGEAVACVQRDAPEVLDAAQPGDDPGVALVRINVAEALVELGRFDEAEALLASVECASPLLVAGSCNARGWLATTRGLHEEGLALAETVAPEELGSEYAAEAPLTRALCLLNLGRWAEARLALDDARQRSARASTRKNVLLHEARWAVETGALEQARATLGEVKTHSWLSQGGAALLALGDAFAAHGCHAEAREAWELSASRDPECHAAAKARARLAE